METLIELRDRVESDARARIARGFSDREDESRPKPARPISAHDCSHRAAAAIGPPEDVFEGSERAQGMLTHISPLELRWSLLSPKLELPEEAAFRFNAELVNSVVSLIFRGTRFLRTQLDGHFADPSELTASARASAEIAMDSLSDHRLHQARSDALSLATEGNRHYQHHAPWQRVLTHPEDARRAVTESLEWGRAAAVLVEPFVPALSVRLLGMLGLPPDPAVGFRRRLATPLLGRQAGPGDRLERADPARFVEAFRFQPRATREDEG